MKKIIIALAVVAAIMIGLNAVQTCGERVICEFTQEVLAD